MIKKIKTFLSKPNVRQYKDTRVLGLIVFGIIALMVSWSGIKSIQSNYELQQQIVKLEQQNKLKELENDNLKLKNQYFKTDEFLELTARRQFGKAAPGEKVVVIPKNVALSHITNSPTQHQAENNAKDQKPHYQKNFEAWINFFLHRDNKNNAKSCRLC